MQLSRSILSIALLGLPIYAGAQSHFRWSIHSAHELSERPNLSTTTVLSAKERNELIHRLADLVRPFAKENGTESERELLRLAAKARIEVNDLDNDGTPEIILQAWDYHFACGATGNCAFWIFRKTDAGYQLILDTRGKDGVGGAEMITIRQSSTQGFHDIVLAAHDSASEKSLLVYKFNGSRYVQRECYIADWTDWSSPERKSMKAPAIGRCPAN